MDAPISAIKNAPTISATPVTSMLFPMLPSSSAVTIRKPSPAKAARTKSRRAAGNQNRRANRKPSSSRSTHRPQRPASRRRRCRPLIDFEKSWTPKAIAARRMKPAWTSPWTARPSGAAAFAASKIDDDQQSLSSTPNAWHQPRGGSLHPRAPAISRLHRLARRPHPRDGIANPLARRGHQGRPRRKNACKCFQTCRNPSRRWCRKIARRLEQDRGFKPHAPPRSQPVILNP